MNLIRIVVRGIIVTVLCVAVYGFLQAPVLVELFRPSRSINVLVWPNVFDREYIELFERESGIKVNISYFDSYEELVTKIQSGLSDYDLIMASDYSINILKNAEVIKPFDKNKLDFWSKLNPNLLGFYYDPDNTYTIPLAWEVYGLGVNLDYYGGEMPEASWGLLFDKRKSPPLIGMLDDARELTSIAALYLFGMNKRVLDKSDMEQIGALLKEQKKRVLMYTDFRTNYLLASRSAPVVLGISSEIYSAMRHDKAVKFILPKEGSFFLIYAWFLPKSTTKDEWVYQFLSFLYQPEVIGAYADRYTFFTALNGVTAQNSEFSLTPTKELFLQLRLFDYEIPKQLLQELWISLKS